MIENQLLQLAGGFGIFIYSLRIITNALDDTASEVLRGFIDRVSQKSYFCVLSGILAAVLLQASTTVVLLAMGLLNRSLLSLPQAVLIMLGASLGTTFKQWGYWDFSIWIAILLITTSSFGILLYWKRSRFRLLEISLGIGLTVLGLQLVSLSLMPLMQSPWLLQSIAALKANTFLNAVVACFLGALAATLVQSSSSVILMTIGFAAKGLVSFEGASALILGANIGTTSTALLLSIGQSVSARRLAIMHFVSKSLGVLMTLLFFKTFLSLVTFLVSQWSDSELVSVKLALVHTGFNAINLVFWWVFLPILVRLSRGVLPDSYDSEYWLSALGVQKLLAKMPERAIYEARAELLEIIRGLSGLTQSCGVILNKIENDVEKREKILKSILRDFQSYEKRFENIEQVLSRVASRFDENHQLRDNLFFVLQRSYKISRVLMALKDFINSIDSRSVLSEINTQVQTQEMLKVLLKKIQDRWDEIYQTLPEDSECQKSFFEMRGAFIYQSFYQEQDYLDSLKTQKIYSVLLSLEKELSDQEDLFVESRESFKRPNSVITGSVDSMVPQSA